MPERETTPGFDDGAVNTHSGMLSKRRGGKRRDPDNHKVGARGKAGHKLSNPPILPFWWMWPGMMPILQASGAMMPGQLGPSGSDSEEEHHAKISVNGKNLHKRSSFRRGGFIAGRQDLPMRRVLSCCTSACFTLTMSCTRGRKGGRESISVDCVVPNRVLRCQQL